VLLRVQVQQSLRVLEVVVAGEYRWTFGSIVLGVVAVVYRWTFGSICRGYCLYKFKININQFYLILIRVYCYKMFRKKTFNFLRLQSFFDTEYARKNKSIFYIKRVE